MKRSLGWLALLCVVALFTMPLSADVESAKRKLAELQIQYDEPSFLWVVKEGRIEPVRLFLEAGMTPTIRDANSGFTILMLAANMGHAEVVDALVTAGADVNAKDNSGNSALLFAAMMGHAGAIQSLMKHRADPNLVEAEQQSTPLHLVIRNAQPGYVDAMRAIIAGGAKLDVRDSKGMTPLLLAASRCEHTAAVVLLLQAGADANAKDSFGSTPLALATALGCTESADAIRAAGGKK